MASRTIHIQLSAPAVIALAALIAGALLFRTAFAAGRSAESGGAAGRAVVSIDLGRMFAELDETEVIRVKLKAMDDEIAAFRTARTEEIDQLSDELEVVPPAGPRARELGEQILLKANERDAWVDAKSRIRALEESIEYVRMYNQIVEAAAALAESQNYDFILLDDTDLEMSTNRSPKETVAQLFARRIIARSPAADVTADLIDRMNNAFAAGE